MVNRRSATGTLLDISEAVTPLEALRTYTILGAWSGFEEMREGSLEPGKLADVAVLTHDPFTIDPDEIRSVRSTMTFVGGVEQFRAVRSGR